MRRLIGILILAMLVMSSSVSAISQYNLTNGTKSIAIFNGTGGATSFTVPSYVNSIELLVISAGGSGGHNMGGGGGAGGVSYNSSFSVVPGATYNLGIGTGGAPSMNNGTASFFGNATVNLSPLGGGAGGSNANNGRAGGSGGGGGSGIDSAGSYTGGANVSGQGFPGGNVTHVGQDGGGGGGGYSSAGASTASVNGGNGGTGFYSVISGTGQWYAGGGGGGVNTAVAGTGGSGVGGNGAIRDTPGTNGTANTGSGGGGGGGNNVPGKYGANGVVIISYTNTTLFSDWVAYGDAWKSTNNTHTILMWNSTGDHSFVSAGNASTIVEMMVIGAGGGGGGYNGGGGGAGGLIYNSSPFTVSSTVAITIGTKGSGGTAPGITGNHGTNGTSTVFGTLTAPGGGWGGGDTSKSGANGASGGGGAPNLGSAGLSTAISPVFGNNGAAAGNGAPYRGGGGGGAMGSGVSGATTGVGGIGFASSITGTNTTYCTGGTAGVGSSAVDGTNATINSGNGGNGGGAEGHKGGDGSDGLVMIKFLTPTGAAPVANFTASSNPAYTLSTVTFTDISTNAPTSWSWNFDDGNTSSLQNPTNVFVTAGTYHVSLNATNSFGSNTTTLALVVSNPPAPVANFTHIPNPSVVGESVAFSDVSTGSPTSWDWIFGDGSGNITTQNPNHVYSLAGNYSVFLRSTSVWGNNVTMKYHLVNNASGFNQQDIIMSPVFTFIIHITDAASGVPILAAAVTDASTGTIYTTTNGTVIIDTPYTTFAGWIQADGYDAEPFSKVIDEDTTETYQLTKATTSNSSQVQYSSAHNVKILVKDAWIGPIEGVNVTATYVEASGPFDWLFAWIGVISSSDANVQNTTLYGHTGTDGAINFLMVESVQYNITAEKPGVVSKSMLIYPKDDDYTIWTQEMNASFLYESGYNELDIVRVSVNGTEFNQTYGRVMVVYSDKLNQTNSVLISINQTSVLGNTTVENAVTNLTVTGDSDFTSALYLHGSRDQSYIVHVSPRHALFGNMSPRDFGVTFPPGPISLGLPENMLHLIGMGMLLFITLAGFAISKPGETVIVAAFFAWVFFFMRWWTQMAPSYIVISTLVGMAVFAIFYNIVLRSKKVILS